MSAQHLIELADERTGLQRDSFLSHLTGTLRIDQEIKQVKLLRQLCKPELRVVLPRLLNVKVMDAEIVEIADDDGICTLRVTHGVHVPFRLLKGGHHNPLTWLRLIQVRREGLLLDNRLGGRDSYVDEASLGG